MLDSASAELRGNRRTFVLGVLNGGLYNASTRLVDTTVVLSVLAASLVHSKTLVGLLVTLFNLGWMWPSLFMPWVLEGQPSKLLWYRIAGVVRVTGYAGIAIILFGDMPTDSPSAAFWLVAGFLFLGTSFGGVSWIPFMALVAKNVRSTRRGFFWSARQGLAGLLGVGAAWVVNYMLAPERGFEFPRGYAWLFAFATGVQATAIALFAVSYERPDPARKRRMSVRMHLVRGLRILRRDAWFRPFALTRIVLSAAGMGVPFVALLGEARFGMTAADTADLLLPVAMADVFLPFVWGAISDRMGSRAAIRVSGFLCAAHAALALAAPAADAAWGLSLTQAKVLLASSLVVGQAALTCWSIAHQNYILDLAPHRMRDAYIAVNNILGVPLAATTLIAGLIADYLGLGMLYAGALVLSVCGVALAYTHIVEPRPADLLRRGVGLAGLIMRIRSRPWTAAGRRE